MTAEPDRAARVERPPEEMVLLELRLGRGPARGRVLAEGILGYATGDGVLLALGEMAAALELAIEVNPSDGTAQGWFLSEDRRFALDVPAGRVTVEGRPAPFDAAVVELHADGVYVGEELLSLWFPVDLEVNLSRLVVEVSGRETLPVERRLERRARWRRNRASGVGEPRFQLRRLPYRAFRWPAVEGRLALSRSPDGRMDAGLDARLSGELLFLTGELFVSSPGLAGPSVAGRAGTETPRLRLGRRRPGGGLLGPLDAREVSFGDLYTPEQPLVTEERAGRGLVVSTFPLHRPALFDHLTLRGEALPGWQVELYRNGTLLGFREVGEDGRYAFEDVPVLVGFNLFRRVLHGPHGERREVVDRVLVGDGTPRPGEHRWRLAVAEEGRGLFGDELRRPVDGESPAGSLDEPRHEGPEDPPGVRALFDYEVGVTRGLALTAGLASLPERAGRWIVPRLGLRGGAGAVFGRLDVATDLRGGSALGASLQARLGSWTLAGRQESFHRFRSDVAGRGDERLVRRRRLRLDGRARVLPERPVALGLSFDEEAFATGERRRRWSLRTTVRTGPVALTPGLSLTHGGAGGARRLAGTLLTSLHRGELRLRGRTTVEISPRLALGAVDLTVERALRHDRSLHVEVGRGFETAASGVERTTAAARLVQGFAGWRLGAGARWSSRTGVSGELVLAFGLGREPRTGSWRRRPPRDARRGAASVRVFLDRDQDGRFGPRDAPIRGAEFLVDGVPRRGATDDRGLLLLTGLPMDRHVDVGLREGSLEDPFWLPVRPGVGLVPRAGAAAPVDFPVVVSGEVDGTVFLEEEGRRRPVSNVLLQLLAAGDGEVAAEARSAFDGFYLLDRIPPGRYRLRVAPGQVTRLGLSPPETRELEIGPDGTVLSGMDVILCEPEGGR